MRSVCELQSRHDSDSCLVGMTLHTHTHFTHQMAPGSRNHSHWEIHQSATYLLLQTILPTHTSFQHSSLDGAQAGPISRLERHLTTSTPNIAAFDHLAHYRSSNQRGSMKGPTKTKHHPTPSNELQRNSTGEHWINRSPLSGSQQLPS